MRNIRAKNGHKEVCARNGCKNKFIKRVHNQRYCSKECCQKATNERLLTKYHENKKPVAKNRKCKTRGCQTVLSQYNREDKCGPCQHKEAQALLKKL